MRTKTRITATLITATLATLALAGCTLASTLSEPTIENTADLQELYVDAGGFCPQAVLVSSEELGGIEGTPMDMSTVKVAGCTDADGQDVLGVLMVFEDAAHLDEYVTAANADLAAKGQTWESSGSKTAVTGGNWMVLVDMRSNPGAIAEAMHGEVLTGP